MRTQGYLLLLLLLLLIVFDWWRCWRDPGFHRHQLFFRQGGFGWGNLNADAQFGLRAAFENAARGRHVGVIFANCRADVTFDAGTKCPERLPITGWIGPLN